MPFDLPEIDTDVDAVTTRIIDGLIDRLSDDDGAWIPVEGAPEVGLAEELGREVAVLNQSFLDVLQVAVANGIGETIFGFPSFDGVAATVPVTIELNTAGSVIPAGFAVFGVNENGDQIAFTLTADVGTVETSIDLTMTATELGMAGNGVPAGALTIITATSNVVSVTATGPSANGADPELISDYLDRFVDYVSTLRPGGVNSTDVASLARSVPGVHRALGVDLYDPGDPDTPTERTVTVFPVDETSHPVSSGVKAQLESVIAAVREVNFIVHVEDPDYTAVHIAYVAVAETGADPATVETEINAAITAWLGSWGTTSTDDQAWVATSTVRYTQAVRVAGSAPGVAYLSSLTINGSAADFVLSGVAALPTPFDDPTTPSTVSGTVS